MVSASDSTYDSGPGLPRCYCGDIGRKKTLLQKQAKGKKRMNAIGKVELPQDAFMAVLKLNQ